MEIDNVMRQWALDQHFLHDRMSFICGPRQIGKATLARRYLERIGQLGNYHNWDLAFQVIETPGYLKQVDRSTFVLGLDRLLRLLP